MSDSVALGDMTVLLPAHMPAKLLKALAVIAAELHAAFDRQPWMRAPGYSKKSCLLMSLTVRDFLQAIGFRDATVRCVAAIMQAEQNGQTLHSVGVGLPGQGCVADDGHFVGHMVALVPSARVLIDTTLYQAIRPQWHGALGGMMAAPYGAPIRSRRAFGFDPFAAAQIEQEGHRFVIWWLDTRGNKGWRAGGDNEPWRRAAVLAVLRERFGTFQ